MLQFFLKTYLKKFYQFLIMAITAKTKTAIESKIIICIFVGFICPNFTTN